MNEKILYTAIFKLFGKKYKYVHKRNKYKMNGENARHN